MSNVFIPDHIKDACQFLAEPNTIACAGATNLYVDRYFGKCLDFDMVSLHKLDSLKHICQKEDGLHIGSMCTFDQLENELKGQGSLDALSQAASLVGGPQVRNRGTIGGNIISASPSADTVPVLMAFDAILCLTSIHGDRQVPIREFMTGVKKTAIKPEELLTEIIIPSRDGQAIFAKVGKRNALAIAVCNLCLYMRTEDTISEECDDKQSVIKEIAIAIGSCGPTCLRAASIEAMLTGRKKPSTEEEWKAIKEAIGTCLTQDISPIDDVRATASYRSKVAENLIYHNLKTLWEDA